MVDVIAPKGLGRKNAVLAIAVGGVVAGTLDLLQASILFGWDVPLAIAGGLLGEHTGEMLYKTDRRHGLHHGGEQLAFPALAWRTNMRLCLGKRLEPWTNACSSYRAI